MRQGAPSERGRTLLVIQDLAEPQAKAFLPETVPVVDATEAPVEVVPPKTAPAEDGANEVARLRAENAKLQNDLRSQQIGVMRQTERDALLREVPGIRDEVVILRRTNSALLRALGSGETEALPKELERIEGEAETERGRRSFDERAGRLSAEVQQAIQGEDGKPLFDLVTVPELAEARALWQRGISERDLGALSEATSDVHREVLRFERQRAKEGREGASRTPPAPAPALVRPRATPGVNDLATPKPAGGTVQFRSVDEGVDGFLAGHLTKEQLRQRFSEEQLRDLRSRYGITV